MAMIGVEVGERALTLALVGWLEDKTWEDIGDFLGEVITYISGPGSEETVGIMLNKGLPKIVARVEEHLRGECGMRAKGATLDASPQIIKEENLA